MLASLALVVACADDPVEPVPATSVRLLAGHPGLQLSVYPAHAGEPVDDEEWKAAEYVARTLALGFADPAIRATIKEALSLSNTKEGKLHFAS
ncbi:MAG: hypothetical protein ABIV11_04590 [Gemmatimonadaceae bacterium]